LSVDVSAVPSLLHFLFSVFRDTPSLHSFPTRRSSDLILDLSKYFDTLNHTILLNLLRKQIKDERVIQMVKRYLKSGVMENGVVTDRKSTRLNSSHVSISYAVFCLKKKNTSSKTATASK